MVLEEMLTGLHFLGGRKLQKLTIAVTYACNLTCKTCGIWKIYRESPFLIRDELKTWEFKRIAEENNSVRYISITGGEPTMRSDLPEITGYFGREGIRLLSINTNGAVPDRVVEAANTFLEKGGKKVRVHVSLMGPRGVDEDIRGNYSFSSAINAVKTLRKAEIPVYIEITVSPFNIRYLEKTLDVAEKLVSRKHILITFYNVAQYYRNEDDKVERIDIRQIAKSLLKYGGWGLENNLFLHIAKRFPQGTNRFCPAGKVSVFVDPYGNVYPCILRGDRLGNVRDYNYSILSVLENSRDLINKIRRGCSGCITPCETMTGLAAYPWNFFLP